MNPNHMRGSRSASRPRTGNRQRPRQINPFDVVKFINSVDGGRIDIRSLRNVIFPDVDPRSNVNLHVVWNLLFENKDNFVLSDPTKNPHTLSGNEIVWVRTVLGLCRTHCRRGKDGRNRACDGDCGALHVCRTFLLRSENACPFNTNKKKCMFGHRFATEHNVEILKQHGLFGLSDMELQQLFRRRPSRSASTLPQVCIYYNKADGKKCSKENCKSLHLCSDFILQCCDGDCSRNHKLTTPQVLRVFDLFAFDKSWTSEMLLEDLRHFMTARQRGETNNGNSSGDSDASYFSVAAGQARGGFPRRTTSVTSVNSLENYDPSSPLAGQVQMCVECEDLKKELNKVKLTVSWLTSQVHLLTKIVEGLKDPNMESLRSSSQQAAASEQAEVDGQESSLATCNLLANQKSDNTLPVDASSHSLIEEEVPRFVRSQLLSTHTGVPPKSSQFEQ